MLKLQFFEQIYFFHQKWFVSNGKCNPDNGSKYFSLRVHTFAAQIPKTTKKNFELFERKITFLKIFLCTCRMQLWQPCRFFLVKTLKKFCWISGNEEKLISLPKNLFVKIFVWTCTTNFWQACRNHACKNTKNHFRSKSENDNDAKHWKKKFSFISLFQEIKKTSSGHAECSCDHTAESFLTKFWKIFDGIPEIVKIWWGFQKNYLSKCSSEQV